LNIVPVLRLPDTDIYEIAVRLLAEIRRIALGVKWVIDSI
jgi:hypothetical protein